MAEAAGGEGPKTTPKTPETATAASTRKRKAGKTSKHPPPELLSLPSTVTSIPLKSSLSSPSSPPSPPASLPSPSPSRPLPSHSSPFFPSEDSTLLQQIGLCSGSIERVVKSIYEISFVDLLRLAKAACAEVPWCYKHVAPHLSLQQVPFSWQPVCRMEPILNYQKKILETHCCFKIQ